LSGIRDGAEELGGVLSRVEVEIPEGIDEILGVERTSLGTVGVTEDLEGLRSQKLECDTERSKGNGVSRGMQDRKGTVVSNRLE